jgi:hypothetical protein
MLASAVYSQQQLNRMPIRTLASALASFSAALTSFASNKSYILTLSLTAEGAWEEEAALSAVCANIVMEGPETMAVEAAPERTNPKYPTPAPKKASNSIDMAPLLYALLYVLAADDFTNATFLEANCLWFAVGAKPAADRATPANTARLNTFIFV